MKNNSKNSADSDQIFIPPAMTKRYSVFMEIVSVISAAGFSFGMFADISVFAKLVIAAICSGMYMTVLIGKGSGFVRLVPLIVPVCTALLNIPFGDVGAQEKNVYLTGAFILIGSLLASNTAAFAAAHKFTKSMTLAAGSASAIIYGGICACINIFAAEGALSASLIVSRINSLFDGLRSGMVQIFKDASETDGFISQMRIATGNVSLTAEEFMKNASEYAKLAVTGLKAISPALVIIAAMLFMFVSLFVLTALLCIANKRGFFGRDLWEYEISGFGARVFNACVLIALLGTFIGMPRLLLTVCVNLLLILLPLMFHIGLRGFYRIFVSKGIHPVASVVLLAAAVGILFALTGGFVMLIAAFAGVFFSLSAENFRKLLYRYGADGDMPHYNGDYSDKNDVKDNADNDNNNDNDDGSGDNNNGDNKK